MITDYSVSIDVRVVDPQALWDAAYEECVFEEHLCHDQAVEELGTREDPNVSNCIRFLIDPGSSPPGLEIQDSQVTGTFATVD